MLQQAQLLVLLLLLGRWCCCRHLGCCQTALQTFRRVRCRWLLLGLLLLLLGWAAQAWL
jgi:hypothetical protein